MAAEEGRKPSWLEQMEEKHRAEPEGEELDVEPESLSELRPIDGGAAAPPRPVNGPGREPAASESSPPYVTPPGEATERGDGGASGRALGGASRPNPAAEPARTAAEPAEIRRRSPSAATRLSGTGAREPSPLDDMEDAGIGRLRREAVRAAREDAAAGVPSRDGDGHGPSDSERDLVERCRAFFDRWKSAERRWLHGQVAEKEEGIADKLSRASLGVDRYERLTKELLRLKAKLSIRRQEVASELDVDEDGGTRGLSTRVYAAAIGFLGVVEFFANAPVFSSLLPRDPLTERQIRLVAETSEGWLSGAERVFAHLILRPDAALLAAGVVTFLCVLAHFFGHSLRAAVMQKDQEERFHVRGSSQVENIIPMMLSGLGLILVLGVLYEARVTLGEVGEQQYNTDMAQVEEWRREAGWLRADGDLLAANQLSNQAEDLEGAATALLEYAHSMSRLSFPILLLNSTLVLCAISAAYFHRRTRRREHFNESPFERERSAFIEEAESTAQDISGYLSSVTRDIRQLRSLSTTPVTDDQRSMIRQLESVVSLYRAENGRARGIDPSEIPAFREPVDLGVEVEIGVDEVEPLRSPREYDEERNQLRVRFEEARKRFNEEGIAWT